MDVFNSTALNNVVGNATLFTSVLFEPLSSMFFQFAAGAAVVASVSSRVFNARQMTADSPGYSASNVQTFATGLTADLTLAGPATNTYGNDIHNLKLMVNYDTGQSTEKCGVEYTKLTGISETPPYQNRGQPGNRISSPHLGLSHSR